jgi:serine/threonine protein phosphatase 1
MRTAQPPSTIPSGHRVYAIGDIHGRADLLTKLLGVISADADGRGAALNRLVYLGDYVDRGPDSRGVIDLVLDGVPSGFSVVTLMGNHEEMMRRFVGGEIALGRTWMINGGDATLASYGIDPPGWLDGSAAYRRASDELAASLPQRHRDFLGRLALSHELGDYFFVHAGVRPGVPLPRQLQEDLLWIRDEFLDSEDDFGKRVVHGHSIAPKPMVERNRIGIDTGAYASGTLTALVLEGDEWRLMQT